MQEKNIRPIGGFFEFEITHGKNVYHKNAVALTNGRACMSLIIQQLNPQKIYLPFYTCDALFEPMISKKIKYEFYSINRDLEPETLPVLNNDEYFLYINFFGIKNRATDKLIKLYTDSFILDNTHDFFNRGYKNTISFTSARKYFGVPDGAYLYMPKKTEQNFERFKKVSIDHLVNRLIGNQELSYKQFLAYEKSLTPNIKRISTLSEIILSNINYGEVINKRKENYLFWSTLLNDINQLKLENVDANLNPFCYPFLPFQTVDKKALHQKLFFIPSYWPDTQHRKIKGYKFERYLSNNLLPLPIDHRYDKNDLKRLAKFLLDLLKNN
jgi:hypothetical protein